MFDTAIKQPLNLEQALNAIDSYWAHKPQGPLSRHMFPIMGTKHDQPVPDGISNPYWELIRRMPSLDDHWRGITPHGYTQGLDIGRNRLVGTYAWSIPSPGDIAWISSTLNGRGMVEVGAGSGYWAWQLAQAGVDIIAYEPTTPADNPFVVAAEPYYPLLRGDGSAAAKHPDRALFMSWPTYSDPWAAHALASYQGDLLVYVGEESGGCCGDDAFFELLDARWTEIEASPHHRTWWGINCRMVTYRRNTTTEET